MPLDSRRILIVATAAVLLLVVYLTQRINYVGWMDASPNTVFIFNRLLRFLVNDLLCIAIIYALFGSRRYVTIAWYVFLIELLLILPVYFYAKLSTEGPSEISSPLLSPIHRMVVNPLLMIILIGGFYYQRFLERRA